MAETFLRSAGLWAPVGGDIPPGGGGSDFPLEGPVPKPDTASTGPRIAVTGATLDSTAAKNLAAANGGVLVGRRIANLILSSPADANLTFRDCEITGAWFGVDAWFGQGTPPSNPASRTTFEHCLIHDVYGNAGIAGRNWVARYCEFVRNGDDAKPGSYTEIFASFMHELWAQGVDPHGDNLQSFGGDDILIHWNTIEGLNSLDAPTQPGGVASSVLQMSNGSVVSNFRFFDNWVDGGAYTLRGAENWGGLAAHLLFRRNKHGRRFGYGPITSMGSYNGGLAVSDYDSSNIWADSGLPVLG